MDETKSIICEICHQSFKSLPSLSRHITLTHKDTNIEEYYLKYILCDIKPVCLCGCNKFTKFYGLNKGFTCRLNGHNPSWLKGLTKNDPRVAKLIQTSSQTLRESYASGKIVPWNKDVPMKQELKDQISNSCKIANLEGRAPGWRSGLTKENDSRLRESAQKISKTLIEKFENKLLIPWRCDLTRDHTNWNKSHSKKLTQRYKDGFKSWMLGLTKENDIRIANKSKFIMSSFDDIKQKLELITWCNVLNLSESIYDGQKTKIQISCKKCNFKQITTIWKLLHTNRCIKCFPNVSKAHFEISKFLDSINIDYKINDRQTINPYELDIFIKSHNFAIEFNGLYYHSNIDENYHNNKTLLCLQKNINLFHIFEDEWKDKQQIVKSIITHKLHLTPNKINLKNCNICVISNQQAINFLQINHLDYYNQNIENAIALFHNNEIMSIMTFMINESRYEVQFYCTKLYTHIPGAFTKLLNYINHDVHLYHDTRYGNIFVCEQQNFNITNNFKQNVWYTNKYKRFLEIENHENLKKIVSTNLIEYFYKR